MQFPQVNEKDTSLCFRDNEAAKLLGVSAEALRKWRWAGRGPRFHRIGPRTIRYTLRDINDYLEKC